MQNTLFDVLGEHPSSTFTDGNVSMKISQRKTLDMSADDKLNELKAQVKAREAYLKSLKAPTHDPDTGEIIEKPIEKYSEFITIKY